MRYVVKASYFYELSFQAPSSDRIMKIEYRKLGVKIS